MDILKWLWLLDTPTIGAKRAVALYDYFESIDKLYENDDMGEYLKIDGIKPEIAMRLAAEKDLTKYENILDIMYLKNINYITIEDDCYPLSLREIYDYPPVLFYKGKNLFVEENPMISIVGTRRASTYGMNVAKSFARDFSNKGIDVVSGMAMGIDTCVHKGAIEGMGDTIAVLGCGVDVVYPRSNQKLYDEIIEGRGMVVSEYLPMTSPISSNFPARNRIISGLSQATIVVEASYKSGSLITARCANEQGRDVYVVPGNINSRASDGSNALLKDGANIILSPNDVLEDLYYMLKRPSYERITDIMRKRIKESKERKEARRKAWENYNLSNEEISVIKLIEQGNNTIDAISRNLDMGINLINSILTMLEIKGIVITTGAKIELK